MAENPEMLEQRKRKLEEEDNSVNKVARKSRFAPADALPLPGTIDIAAAAEAARARALEISRNLLQQPSALNMPSMNAMGPPSLPTDSRTQLAAQIASVSAFMGTSRQQEENKTAAERKSKNMTLRLDAQGREIDEYGNVVKMSSVKSTIANVAVEKEAKKKDNPYLAHRVVRLPPGAPGVPLGTGATSVIPTSSSSSSSSSTGGTTSVIGAVDTEIPADPAMDDRLVLANRNKRGKRALHFVEAGKYVAKEETIRMQEERKIIAGYSSGRKAPELITGDGTVKEKDKRGTTDGPSGVTEDDGQDADGSHKDPSMMETEPSSSSSSSSSYGSAMVSMVLPRSEAWGGGTNPTIEWWDEAFLPKDLREARKRAAIANKTNLAFNSSKDNNNGSGTNSFTAVMLMTTEECYAKVNMAHVKTYIYVQHPASIKALGGEKPEVPLPMYLTKKERKRIRKTAREQREQEKRDKLMMGLIAAPEPKFKLSNFMKLLGDQAIADPSKVELRVLEQMRQRELTHEMRNLSRKLTPAERKAKKMKKLQEDTTRQVTVAVFRVEDLSDPKHRFKVDVNAQQFFLTGTVVLCQQPEDASTINGKPQKGFSLVVVEGGPKGIKKFVRLMIKRIDWDAKVEAYATPYSATAGQEEEEEDEEDDDDDDEDEDDDEDAAAKEPTSSRNSSSSSRAAGSSGTGGGGDGSGGGSSSGEPSSGPNACHLVWQGVLAKRSFPGFKFQECRSFALARKQLESRNVAHYWDMCAHFSNNVE